MDQFYTVKNLFTYNFITDPLQRIIIFLHKHLIYNVINLSIELAYPSKQCLTYFGCTINSPENLLWIQVQVQVLFIFIE